MASRGCRAPMIETASLLRRFEGVARGFDLGGFFLAQLDDVFDERLVVEFVDRLAVEIDHAGAGAAAGKADIGFAPFARPIAHPADDGNRPIPPHVLPSLLQNPPRLTALQALPP